MFKFSRNDRYTTIALYAFFVIVGSTLAIMAVLNFSSVLGAIEQFLSVLAPFIYAFIIAYLCNPILSFYEKRVFKFKKAKTDKRALRRTLSLIATVVSALAILAVIAYAIIPQTVNSLNDFANKLNGYIDKLQSLADNVARGFLSSLFGEDYASFSHFLQDHEITLNVKSVLSGTFDIFRSSFSEILNFGTEFVGELINVFFGIILAVYFLINKEKMAAQAKKILASFQSRRTYLNTIRLFRYTHKTFGGFLVGKIIDSFIIAIISLIILLIFGVPYAPLLATILGITNIIPTFGPIIGGIIGGFLVLIASPGDAISFLIVVILIQQIDGNIIAPKILGDSIGIGAHWVIIAVLLGSGLFGFAGMVFGVPTLAILYTLIKQSSERRLKKKNLPVSTEFYKNDPPLEDKIEPGKVFISKETPIPEITTDDDIPFCETEKKEPFLTKMIHKKHKTKGGKKQ